jgi:hypothetical protein
LEQERALLEYYGPDYYQVQNVRARIRVIADLIALNGNGQRQTANIGDQGNVKGESESGQVKVVAKRAPAKTEGSRENPASTTVETDEESAAVRDAATQPLADFRAATQNKLTPRGVTEKNVLATRADRRAAEWESPGSSLSGILTFRHVVAAIVGLTLGMAIQFAISLCVLHRFASRFSSPLVRVEVANPSPMAPSQSLENGTAGARNNWAAVAPGALAERKLLVARIQTSKSGAISGAAAPAGTRDTLEEALVQELCQQNVWLREQIDQLETVAA